jgi:uncharacterized phage protein (TIGR02220 family)
MANKRMFTMKICDSDAFLDMPLSAQALYFHLNMRADDDGFIGNSKRIVRLIGASEDDFRILLMKRFLIAFEDGVIVIKHWRMHNTLSQNRYHETQYLEEKSMLRLKENGSYSLEDGAIINDQKMIEASTRQSRRTIDAHETDSDIDIDLDKDKELDKDLYKSIVEYLNQKAGTHYKPSSKSTQTKIHARLNEGFTLDDFKTVIDKKVAEWKGTEMEQYLRPETLFGTKFEGYLNAKIVKSKPKVTNKFNDFPQRDIDFDSLEKKLLARG